MSLQSRVRKITVDLRPEQHGMNYVASARQQHGSFAEYIRSFLARPEPPLEELREQVSDSVENAMPEAEEREVTHAVREAVRRAVFSCFLHYHVTTLASEEERILSLMSLLTEEMLGRLLSTELKPPADPHDESALKDRAVVFLETTKTLALRLYAFREAVKSIEDSYFKGMEVLFDSSAATFKEVGKVLEITEGVYNAIVVGRYTWAGAPLDLENLRAASCDKAKSISDDLVVMAEVDALLYIGDQDRAREVKQEVGRRLTAL
jgi:hypothetical protein